MSESGGLITERGLRMEGLLGAYYREGFIGDGFDEEGSAQRFYSARYNDTIAKVVIYDCSCVCH